jgi:branched-chain amino acid transport system substrate-binding protein
MNKKVQRSLALASAATLVFCVSAVSSATAAPKSVSLAFQAPLTGSNALTGQDELTAVKFALSEYNATNPAIKVELVIADDQGLADVAAILAPGIASNKKIIGLIGPAFSGATQASLPAYKSGRLPLISMSATLV